MTDTTDTEKMIADLKAEIAALKGKNSELITEKKTARQQADEAREAAEAASEEKARASKDLEGLEKSLAAKFQKQIESERQRADTASNQLHALLVDRGIDEALSTANVAPQFKKAATALLKSENKVEIADGAATINGTALADFVGSWAKTDGAAYIAAPVNAGGGATGSTGTQTAVFTKENFASKTSEFMALAKTDKAQAIQIAQSIGRDDIVVALNQ